MLVSVAVLLSVTVPAVFAATRVDLSAYEQQIVKLVNHERVQRRLPKLHVNARLVDAARAHAADMGTNQYFQHESLDGESFGDRIARYGYDSKGCATWRVGEDIAWGAGLYSSPVAVVDDWMASAPHRAVILTRDFRDIGVGAVSSDGYGSVDGTVWFFTMDLGQRTK